MGSMKKLMLGAAMAVGAAAMTAVPAHAAHVGIYVGVGAPAYVPPCPGPGYAWVAGYWTNGVWVPGYWNRARVGYVGPVVRYGPAFHGYYDRGHDVYRDRGPFRR